MMINQGMWNDNPFDSWTEEEEHLSKMGVISFGKGGGGGGQPANTTQTTTSEYPTELKPFIKDIFGKAKGIEEQRSSDGYQAYDAPRIAGFNQDQQDAFTGIRNAQGASTPYFGQQSELIESSTQGPSAARTAQYMNPYTQNVIDIQQRELGRQGDIERQKIGAAAVGSGGYGGSRQAILEAEQMRNQGMRSDDIQARGLNQSYNLAQQAMNQADARGLQGAGMYGQMAKDVPGQTFRELGALAGIGAADQTQQQRSLDLGYRQFQDEYNYPMKTLNDYSAILRGFPLPPSTSTNQTAYSAVAPLSSQLLGAGAGLTGMAGMAGLFGASGGQVKKLQQGGLASMYAPSNRVEFGKTNYADVGDRNKERKLIEDSIKNLRDLNQTDISGFDRQDNETEIRKLQDSFAFNFGPLSSKFQKEYKGIYAEEDYLRDKDRERKEEYQKFRTPEGDAEIMEMDKLVDKKAESKEKEEEKATLDERRMRMATYGPLLKNARAIAEAPTLTSALLTGAETAGDVMAGRIAADEAVIGRAAALRGADIAEMAALAGIQKDLSRDALAIEFLKVAQDLSLRGDTEGASKYSLAADSLANRDVDFGSDIAYLKDKDKVLAAIAAATPADESTPMMFKEGGRVGSAPERSFDFIPKDGKLIAVPK